MDMDEEMIEQEQEVYVIIERRPDGSFVIDKDGLPYHVPQGFPEWTAVNAQWSEEEAKNV